VLNYGKEAAPLILKAWEHFSSAFEQYPFSNPVVYSSQVLWGPAHPLHFYESLRRPTLQNTRDSLDWTRPFGPETVASQFERLSSEWAEGYTIFRKALEKVDSKRYPNASRDLGVARALLLHFKSVARQIHFLQERNRFRASEDRDIRLRALQEMKRLVRSELKDAGALHAICAADSRIGFEAFFQYSYRPHDILEKIVSCHFILRRLIPHEEAKILAAPT
jgi:hypothetical protein